MHYIRVTYLCLATSSGPEICGTSAGLSPEPGPGSRSRSQKIKLYQDQKSETLEGQDPGPGPGLESKIMYVTLSAYIRCVIFIFSVSFVFLISCHLQSVRYEMLFPASHLSLLQHVYNSVYHNVA
jgi:hypothetical protein